MLVWDESGTLAGYGSLSEYRPRRAYAGSVELSVYVHPDFRRKHIGRALMEALIQFAREREDIHTLISQITSENIASIALHRALDFAFCGRVREAGNKFERYLDLDIYQMMI